MILQVGNIFFAIFELSAFRLAFSLGLRTLALQKNKQEWWDVFQGGSGDIYLNYKVGPYDRYKL